MAAGSFVAYQHEASAANVICRKDDRTRKRGERAIRCGALPQGLISGGFGSEVAVDDGLWQAAVYRGRGPGYPGLPAQIPAGPLAHGTPPLGRDDEPLTPRRVFDSDLGAAVRVFMSFHAVRSRPAGSPIMASSSPGLSLAQCSFGHRVMPSPSDSEFGSCLIANGRTGWPLTAITARTSGYPGGGVVGRLRVSESTDAVMGLGANRHRCIS